MGHLMNMKHAELCVLLEMFSAVEKICYAYSSTLFSSHSSSLCFVLITRTHSKFLTPKLEALLSDSLKYTQIVLNHYIINQ